jgi:hypothetical protein
VARHNTLDQIHRVKWLREDKWAQQRVLNTWELTRSVFVKNTCIDKLNNHCAYIKVQPMVKIGWYRLTYKETSETAGRTLHTCWVNNYWGSMYKIVSVCTYLFWRDILRHGRKTYTVPIREWSGWSLLTLERAALSWWVLISYNSRLLGTADSPRSLVSHEDTAEGLFSQLPQNLLS